MDGIRIVFELGSLLLIVIGAVMILRKAFSRSIWWGIGCILIPVLIPVFALLKWTETKNGFIIFTIGASLFTGIYIIDRHDINQAVSKIKIIKVTMTTALDDTNIPVSDLSQISFDDKKVFLHVKIEIPPNKTYRFAGEIYDADEKLVLNNSFSMTPNESIWYAWFYYNFDKSVAIPGEWRFVFRINGKQLTEQNFKVTTGI